MSFGGAGRLLVRQARSEWPVLLVLGALVLVTSFLAAAGPRAYQQVSDQAVAEAFAGAPPAATEIAATSTNFLSWRQLPRVDAELRALMADPLVEVLGESAYGLTTGRYDTFRPRSQEPFRPRPYAWLSLRYQSGLLEAAEFVEGAAPRRAVSAFLESPRKVSLLEIALDEQVAEQLDVRVGDRIRLRSLGETAAVGASGPLTVEVSGLFRPDDRTAPSWRINDLVLEPGQEVLATGDLLAEYAVALVSRRQLDLLGLLAPSLDYDWHYQVQVDELDASNAPAVQGAIAELTATGVTIDRNLDAPLGAPPSAVATSAIGEQLDAYTEQEATAQAVSAVVLAGLLTVALLVLALAAEVSVRRRSEALALERGRGASAAQVVALLAAESALVAVPTAALGYVAAVQLVPSSPVVLSALLSGGIALAAVLLVSVGGWLAHRASGPTAARGRIVTGLRTRRRLLAEVVLVALAVGGLLLLRRRGVGATEGADPFLASVPVLLALAVGVLALRAYPWVLRPLFGLVRRRSGTVAFVSLARSVRRPLAAALPMAVLLLGLGFAVFASAVEQTVVDGQDEAAWEAVGADYRLDTTGFLPANVRAIERTPGVTGVVPAVAPDAEVVLSDTSRRQVRFLALDPAAYAGLTSDAPADSVPRDALSALAAQPEVDGLPAVLVSPGVAAEAVDGVVGLYVPGVGFVDGAVAEVVQQFPTDADDDVVVMDLATLRGLQTAPQRAGEVFVQAGAAAAPALAETVAGTDLQVVVDDRRAVLAATADRALVQGTVSAFRLGVVAAAGYGLLATLLALVLTARPREALLATLRTLGAPRRQVAGVAALELVPLVAAVVLTGWVVGAALPYLLAPALDLTSFTGGLRAPPVRLDWAAAAWLGLGLAVVVAVAVAVTVLVERRRGLTGARGTTGMETGAQP